MASKRKPRNTAMGGRDVARAAAEAGIPPNVLTRLELTGVARRGDPARDSICRAFRLLRQVLALGLSEDDSLRLIWGPGINAGARKRARATPLCTPCTERWTFPPLEA
jgi:hypothetical protein